MTEHAKWRACQDCAIMAHVTTVDDGSLFHPADRVLVAVMNNRRDFALARDEGWYRIPLSRAPASTTEAAVLAFYFTKAFGDAKWAIHCYAAVRGHELAPPIRGLRWRRIAFIEM